jgi:hypothetical protein
MKKVVRRFRLVFFAKVSLTVFFIVLAVTMCPLSIRGSDADRQGCDQRCKSSGATSGQLVKVQKNSLQRPGQFFVEWQCRCD